jgi:hypothetical protein
MASIPGTFLQSLSDVWPLYLKSLPIEGMIMLIFEFATYCLEDPIAYVLT